VKRDFSEVDQVEIKDIKTDLCVSSYVEYSVSMFVLQILVYILLMRHVSIFDSVARIL
jgi:hypothetical protein